MGSFFAKVNHLFPFISVGRRFALQQSLTMLGTRYLYPVGLIPVPVQLANTGARVEIDEIDRKILQGILTLEHRSGRDLGNQLGLPSTTFNNRLKALEQKQVIARHLYLVNPAALGWQAFKLVIVLRGTTESLREDLVRFCQRKENVTVLIQVIGSWDFELSLEVPELSVANQIARELQVAFSSAIASLELLPQGVEHRVSNFPVVGLSNPLRDEKSASVYG
jgi:DNA-binding Lrp family transcriptional regulator